MTAGHTIVALVATIACLARAGAADLDAGKNLYAGCTGCHGEAGISATELTPSVAGQPDVYTQWQLIFYRMGKRKNEAMTGIAQALSNDDIRNLGGYLATLAPPVAASSAAPDVAEKGKALSERLKCAVCHGDGFEGKQGAARLTGQREDYILQTLRDFKSGARTGQGLVNMTEIVGGLEDADLAALAAYVTAAH